MPAGAFSFLRLLRGGSGLSAVVQTGIATVLVLLVNVVTGVISARVLGARGRGELSALLLCPQFLSLLFVLGLPAATIVRTKNAPQQASGLMGAALLLTLVMGVVAAAAGFAILPSLMRQYDGHLVRVAQALLACVFFGVTSAVLVAALQLRDRFGACNAMRLWQSVLTLLGLLALAVVHRFTPITAAIVYLLPAVPFFAWNLWWVLREFKPRLAGWPAHSRTLLSYGMRAQIMDIGTTLFGQIDKLILVAALAPAVFGIYVVVFNLSRLVTTFANSSTPILLPRMAGRSAGEVMGVTSRAFTATICLSLVTVLAFVAFGSVALRWVYGEPFVQGYVVLVLLALEGAIASGAAVLQQPYMVLNRPGALAWIQIISLIAAALLIYLLAMRFSGEGAATGLLIGTSLRFALTYLGFRPLLGARAPQVLPTRAQLSDLLSRARASAA